MMKPLRFLKFLAFLGVVQLTVTALPPSAAENKLPPPPKTGTPTGNPTPATTRPQDTCPTTEKPVTALIANNKNDYTISEYPSFWFYIPYSKKQVSRIEFIVLDESERETVYRTGVQLTQEAGFISLKIPSNPKYALQTNKTYRWYLMLDCQNDRHDEPALVVDGWIQRLDSSYQDTNFIWYDKINNLAQQHFSQPGNPESNQAWVNLLKSLGYPLLIQEPLADSTVISLSQ